LSLGGISLAKHEVEEVKEVEIGLSLLRAFWLSLQRNWKVALSVCFVFIAVIDTFVAQISTIAATFLGLAALPWLLGLFDKVTLPGGIELNLREVERRLDLSNPEVHDVDREPFEFLDLADPNLAMAALRIEIEKRLRRIAKSRGLNKSDARRGIPQLLGALVKGGAVSNDVASAIRDMLPSLNAAAHGAQVPDTADTWVLINGPRILALLDEKY